MIQVFKTSVKNKTQARKLTGLLNTLVSQNGRWNFDLKDRDRILRIENSTLKPEKLILQLQQAGVWCEELED